MCVYMCICICVCVYIIKQIIYIIIYIYYIIYMYIYKSVNIVTATLPCLAAPYMKVILSSTTDIFLNLYHK